MLWEVMPDEPNEANDFEIPFPTEREAEIAYNVLRVGSEPKRSQVRKLITYDNKTLTVKFSGSETRQLRVAVNGFLNHLKLCTDTMAKFGPACSDKYDFY